MKPDINFYKVDRESFLDYEPVSNRLSSFYLDYPLLEDEYYQVANEYILESFHSLFEFVTGENSPSVVIDPETTRSFCGLVENKIQLGTLIFADTRFSQQQKVDAMFAVMLHEMWHKRYTNTGIAASASLDMANYYNHPNTKVAVTKLLPSQLHVDVLNILEDHRIERMGLEEFPGYVFYFDQLRDYIFPFQEKKKLDIGHIAGACVEYLMFKVLIPEMLPWFVKKVKDCYDSAKKVPQIPEDVMFKQFTIFDRYFKDNHHLCYSNDFNELMKAVREIVALIPQEIKNKLAADKKQFSSAAEDYQFDNQGEKSQDEGYDGQLDKVKEELGKAVQNIEKEKQGQESSDAEKMRIERWMIMDANSSIYDEVHIYSPVSGAPSPGLITEARSISNHISRDLGFLASRLNQIQKNYELSEGDLDEDELYSISYSKDLFMEEEENPGFELDFGILIDESGSMAGEKILAATLAAAGIAMACLNSAHVNLFVYGHSQGRFRNNHEGVELYEYINTKRRIRDWKNIFAAQGRGGNADGYAIAKVGEIMLKDSQCRQKVMVVISDGMPAATGYGSDSAEKHVRQVVEMLEAKGIEVIQLCIDNIERSQFMFKHYIPYDKDGNFGKKLREIMQKKLHKFMESF